jgi:hypothetical protein
LFDEIDSEGNGWIDKFRFRLLLRSLKLTFSDDRFHRLYRSVDSSGDGKIEWEELHELLFGTEDEQEAGDPHHKHPRGTALLETGVHGAVAEGDEDSDSDSDNDSNSGSDGGSGKQEDPSNQLLKPSQLANSQSHQSHGHKPAFDEWLLHNYFLRTPCLWQNE